MVKKGAPSLSAQLKDANAPKGSALERIIKDNQDVDVLEPAEFDDRFPYPLWLRVWWRKQHPEVQMPSINPGAAYPEVLSQLYKRMRANPELPWGNQEKMTAVMATRTANEEQ